MKKTSPDGDYFLRFYLHSDPFPVTERDDVLFLTDALKRRLDGTVRAVTGAGKVAVVTAASGGGKSACAHQLAGLIESPWSAAVVEAQADWNTETLAAALITDLVPEELAALPPVPRVYKLLERCDRRGEKPVILVDDAHLLPDPALEFLLQLSTQRYNASCLGFVLLGEDALIERIEDLGLVPGERLHAVAIPAFDRETTREYIEYRLEACGLRGSNPVDDADIARIHRITGGLPGGIHCLAREILINQGRGGAARGGRQLPLLLVLLLALGAGAYLYIRPVPLVPAPAPVAQVAQPATLPEPAGPLRHPPEADSAPTPAVAQDAEAFPMKSGDMPADPFGTAAPTPAESVMVAAAEPAPVAEPPTVAPDVAGMAAPAPDPGPEDTGAVAPGSAGETPASAVAAPAAPDEAAVPAWADLSWRENLRGPGWIRQQADGSYFLQLINASDPGNARRLIERLAGVQADLSGYTNYTPSGRPRYLVLYGVYPDRAAAEAAIADLPPEIRSIPPWPRARSGVLKDMDNAEARGLAP